jgi:hypothetical protein
LLADQFQSAADRARTLADLDHISLMIWKAHGQGAIPDAVAMAASEAVAARRARIKGASPQPLPSPACARRGPPRSPNRQASIERRRRTAMSGIVPSKVAAHFTQGELAVLSVIGRQCQRGGACTLPVDALAALAGVGRTTAQNALRAGRLRGLLQVRERRIPRRKSLTNVVTVVSPEWKGWLKIGNIGFKNMSPTGDKFRREGESAPLRGNSLGQKDRPERPEGAFRGGAGAIVGA